MRPVDSLPAFVPGAANFAGIRIMIVKWDRLWAEMIRMVAAEQFADAEFVLCHTGENVVRRLCTERVDYAIFGLTLPDMDGLDLLASVIEHRAVSRILVMSGRSDDRARHMLRGMKLDGYIFSETMDLAGFRLELERLREGRRQGMGVVPVSPALDRAGIPQLSRILSEAELKVLAVIGDGTDDLEAGAKLGLSAKTVHCHRQRIMGKLNVRTRAELMLVAIRRGIVRIGSERVIRPGFERVSANFAEPAR